MKGGAGLLLLAAAAALAGTCEAYFLPGCSEYLSARSKELAATRGRSGKAKKESVACKAHDILDSLPELNTDVRLAGWRVKQPSQTQSAAAADEPEQAAVGVEEPVLVDTHKQGHLPAVGDVVEYALPPHLLLDDGRIKGVGVLLSINRDRLDAGSLPENKLDLCQIDPLTIDPEAEWDVAGDRNERVVVWKKDELEPRHFVVYKELKKVGSRENGMGDRWKRWVLEEPLSEGCGPPAGAEEVLEIL